MKGLIELHEYAKGDKTKARVRVVDTPKLITESSMQLRKFDNTEN
jgi:hypothetical protein